MITADDNNPVMTAEEVDLLSKGGEVLLFVSKEEYPNFESYIYSLESSGFGTNNRVMIRIKEEGVNTYRLSIKR